MVSLIGGNPVNSSVRRAIVICEIALV